MTGLHLFNYRFYGTTASCNVFLLCSQPIYRKAISSTSKSMTLDISHGPR